MSELPPASEVLVTEIAAELEESQIGLIRKTVGILGHARALKVFEETKKIEAAGGMMTVDGKRRRTPGGVFFRLAKDEATDEERRLLFPAAPGTGTLQTPKIPPTWEETRALISWAAGEPKSTKGEFSVKVTIVGRPKGMRKMETCVAVSIDPHKPSPLPKGIPDVPDGAIGTVIVMIDNRHWKRVSPYLAANKEDDLVCEGYPVFDSKGKTVILAHRVFTRQMQKEQKSRDKQKAKEKKREAGQ